MPSVLLLDLVNTLISAPNTPAAAMGMTVAHESYRWDPTLRPAPPSRRLCDSLSGKRPSRT